MPHCSKRAEEKGKKNRKRDFLARLRKFLYEGKKRKSRGLLGSPYGGGERLTSWIYAVFGSCVSGGGGGGGTTESGGTWNFKLKISISQQENKRVAPYC